MMNSHVNSLPSYLLRFIGRIKEDSSFERPAAESPRGCGFEPLAGSQTKDHNGTEHQRVGG